MNAFNSDVLDRLAVAVDLSNAGAEGALAGGRSAMPGWIFAAHGYQPPTTDADWEDLTGLADRVGGLLRMVAAEDHEAAVDEVNRWLAAERTTPFVERRDGAWALHFHSPRASYAEGWAGGIAAALALGYSAGDAPRIGSCATPACPRLFLDRGRNRQRRFCSLRCQNRAKSASYRRRQATG